MTETNDKKVNLLLSSDDNYAFFLGTVLCSVFENKKSGYDIRVFVIDGGISETNKEKMSVLEERYGFKINFLKIEMEAFKKFPTTKTLPISAYYRMFLKNILPEWVDKILYLDCDIVVLNDIQNIFNENLNGNIIGAVPHYETGSSIESAKRLGLPKDAKYFNSGVLLIDLNLWRKSKTEEECLDFIIKNPDKIRFADQDVLNSVFANKYQALPWKYNSTDGSGDEVYIRHFVDAKPWYRFTNIKFQKKWIEYINKTPWNNQKYKKFMHVSFAKKYRLYPILWIYKIVKLIKKA